MLVINQWAAYVSMEQTKSCYSARAGFELVCVVYPGIPSGSVSTDMMIVDDVVQEQCDQKHTVIRGAGHVCSNSLCTACATTH